MENTNFKVTKLGDDRISSLLMNCERKLTSIWSMDIAYHVLDALESYLNGDLRPRKALEALDQWIHGNSSMMEARKHAFASHHAAKEALNPIATAVARCCGHACATAHVKTHANKASLYGILATMYANGGDKDIETKWQYDHLKEIMNPNS